MTETKIKFRDTSAGKALKWLSLVLFVLFLSFSIFLYNAFTIINEKSIKNIGYKFISGILEANKEGIDPNIESVLSFAKENPQENIQLPTGINEVNINIPAKDISKLTKEDFYNKLPEIAVNSIYDTTLTSILNDNLKANEKMPKILSQQLYEGQKNKNNSLFTLYIFVGLTLLTGICYSFLNPQKKFLFNIGIVLALASFPLYLLFYLINPFIASLIRQVDFVVANMVLDSLARVQFNYLVFFLTGLSFILIGLLIQADIKELFRKKGEYEKVIKIKE